MAEQAERTYTAQSKRDAGGQVYLNDARLVLGDGSSRWLSANFGQASAYFPAVASLRPSSNNASAATFFEGVVEIEAHGLKRGGAAEEHTGKHCRGHGEEQHGNVEGDICF